MTKTQIIVEHVVVTFFEAGIAYLAINQTNLSGNAKLTAIGALGAGLSAAYNVVRQSEPTIPALPVVKEVVKAVEAVEPVVPAVITPDVPPTV